MPRTTAALLAFLAWIPAAAACEAGVHLMFDKPASLEGVVQLGTSEHEAQGRMTYIYLALDKPVCVDAPAAPTSDDDAPQSTEKPVSRVQIAGSARDEDLPVGKHVTIEGTLFAAHTMWHVEDVLIDAADVKPR